MRPGKARQKLLEDMIQYWEQQPTINLVGELRAQAIGERSAEPRLASILLVVANRLDDSKIKPSELA